jgi:hypothetical protein
MQHGIKKLDAHEMALENNSRIFARATSKSAIRGKSITCVTGDNKVTLRNKETGEISHVSVSELETILNNEQ